MAFILFVIDMIIICDNLQIFEAMLVYCFQIYSTMCVHMLWFYANWFMLEILRSNPVQ